MSMVNIGSSHCINIYLSFLFGICLEFASIESFWRIDEGTQVWKSDSGATILAEYPSIATIIDLHMTSS